MAVLTMPEHKAYDKTMAQRLVERALGAHSTAKAAAGAINAECQGGRFRANHQDDFNMTQERYVNSRDYAKKAADGRFVVVIDNAEQR